MRIAFYAPMKPPTHPVPSGDRRIGRLLMAALRRGGHKVELASRLRSWDGAGNPDRQKRIARRGGRVADRLVETYRGRAAKERPAAWFTYHLYYKAPDWLGPTVTERLGIPYLVAEASHAPKRAGGPWALGHDAAAAAIARAEAVLALNPADAECLRPLLRSPDRLVLLRPFLDAEPYRQASTQRNSRRTELAQRFALDPEQPWLLAVAMMRPGDKLASYAALTTALARLKDLRWQLLVVGDGPVREDVVAGLCLAVGDRARYAGRQDGDTLAGIYAASDLYVWPAINEAYGMALLEAQAAGLPVVAGASGGVASIVEDGVTGLLCPVGDPADFAVAVRHLLQTPDQRHAMSAAALARVKAEHSLDYAASTLDLVLHRLVPQGGA